MPKEQEQPQMAKANDPGAPETEVGEVETNGRDRAGDRPQDKDNARPLSPTPSNKGPTASGAPVTEVGKVGNNNRRDRSANRQLDKDAGYASSLEGPTPRGRADSGPHASFLSPTPSGAPVTEVGKVGNNRRDRSANRQLDKDAGYASSLEGPKTSRGRADSGPYARFLASLPPDDYRTKQTATAEKELKKVNEIKKDNVDPNAVVKKQTTPRR